MSNDNDKEFLDATIEDIGIALTQEERIADLERKLAAAREVIKPFARWNLSEHWDGCLEFVEPLNPGDEHSPNLDSLRQAAQWMKNNPEPK